MSETIVEMQRRVDAEVGLAKERFADFERAMNHALGALQEARYRLCAAIDLLRRS